MVSGHSAGGHLAGCMVATDWEKLDAARQPTWCRPATRSPACTTSAPLLHLASNADFKLERRSAPVSPLFWPAPKGNVFDAVVGGIESSEFLRQSKTIADAWAKDNKTRYEAIPGMNHFTVCDPMPIPTAR